MRLLILTFILSFSLYGNSVDSFIGKYEKRNYAEACEIGSKIVYKNRFNENFVQAYCFACLESDNIELIARSLIYLKDSEEARRNAAFFASIVAIKKLLYFSVVDGFDISNLSFPKIDHILSKVFDKYVKKEYRFKNGVYTFSIGAKDNVIMKKIIDSGVHKVVIDELSNGKTTKKHIYW